MSVCLNETSNGREEASRPFPPPRALQGLSSVYPGFTCSRCANAATGAPGWGLSGASDQLFPQDQWVRLGALAGPVQ